MSSTPDNETKGILKHKREGGSEGAAPKKRKGIVWDEANLAYNEENKSATMKIEEPDTPYHHYDSEGDEEVVAALAGESSSGDTHTQASSVIKANTQVNAGVFTGLDAATVPAGGSAGGSAGGPVPPPPSQGVLISDAVQGLVEDNAPGAHGSQGSAGRGGHDDPETWEEAPLWEPLDDHISSSDDDEGELDPEEEARKKAEFAAKRKAHYQMKFVRYVPEDDEDEDEE